MAGIKTVPNGTVQAWLRYAAEYDGDDCLLWPFKTTNAGYGFTTFNRTAMRASRAVCILAHGEPFLIWNHAAHKCGNSMCCNARHLRWATNAENQADRVAEGHSNRGEGNGQSRLTAADVLAIRRARHEGVKRGELAKRFGVTPSAIYQIVTRKKWAWLKGENA